MFDIIIIISDQPSVTERTEPGRSITDNLMAVLILTAGPTDPSDPSGRRWKLCCWCGLSTNRKPITDNPANSGQSIILLVASISVQSREAGVCTSKLKGKYCQEISISIIE